MPFLVGIYAIPRLILGLGQERFGILTLAWTFIGYFSIFDLGLGRALTHAVAQRSSSEHSTEFGSIVRTTLTFMFGLGILAGALVLGFRSQLVRALGVPELLFRESTEACCMLAFAIPLTILSAAFRGILEGLHKFVAVNIVRMAVGTATFLAPAVALSFSTSLFAMMMVLLVCRVATTTAYAVLAVRAVPSLRKPASISLTSLRPLLRFGGWTTVGSMIGPILSNADKFMMSAVVSVAAVAYYTTPYEIVSRLLVLPAALVAVLFPVFTSGLRGDIDAVARTYSRAVRWTFLILFPLVLSIVLLARPLLGAWLGSEFAEHSSLALQLLACGVLFNALAYLPAVLLQAAGHPDIPAKLNALELVGYLPLLWCILPRWGVEGAALLWMARMAIDALLLLLAAHRMMGVGEARWRVVFFHAALAGGLIAAGLLPGPLWIHLLFLVGSLAAWMPLAWATLLDDLDRRQIVGQFRLRSTA